jgi:hypothetical protein
MSIPYAQDFFNEVITSVIENMRQEFVSEGVSEDILEKMKDTWRLKL